MPLVLVDAFRLVLEAPLGEDVVERDRLEPVDQQERLVAAQVLESRHDGAERGFLEVAGVQGPVGFAGGRGHGEAHDAGAVGGCPDHVRHRSGRGRPPVSAGVLKRPNVIGDTLPRPRREGTDVTRATLRLTVPEAIWIGELSRRFPAARIRILAALSDESTGVGLAEIQAEDPRAMADAMAAYDEVPELEVLRADADAALVQFETTLPLLLFAARDSGVPLEMPFDIVDGEARWTLTAPRERLSELCGQLDEFGITYVVERVGGEEAAEPLLTDRQERLLEAAAERGYYATPRRCSLTELADAQGYAKSTVSEVLHRAEGAVIEQYLAERSSPRGSRPPDERATAPR